MSDIIKTKKGALSLKDVEAVQLEEERHGMGIYTCSLVAYSYGVRHVVKDYVYDREKKWEREMVEEESKRRLNELINKMKETSK